MPASRNQNDLPSLTRRTRLKASAQQDNSVSRPITPVTGPMPRRDGDGIAPRLDIAELLQPIFDGLDGLGQSLEGDGPQRGEGMLAASTSQRPYEIGGQDLAAGGLGRTDGAASTTASPK